MFLVANGPVQLSYSSTGVHPEQRSRQSSLSVPREVKDLLLVLTLFYSTLVGIKTSQICKLDLT